MSDRGNVYGGGTYQGGTYQGGSYGNGRHHSDDEDEEQRDSRTSSQRAVDDDDGGTMKVARRGAPTAGGPGAGPNAGGPAAPPPAVSPQQPRSPQQAPPQPATGAQPAYGMRPPAQPPSPARQGQPPASPARGGAAPQQPRPPQGAQPPGPPPNRPAAPAQPPAARPPAAPPSAPRQPAQPPAPPTTSQPPMPPSTSQPPMPPTPSQPPASAPVSAAPVSGPSVSSVAPVSAQPVSGQPVSGQPFSSQPASAQPYSGMPYSGAAPMSGGPVSAMPTSAGLFGVSQVSAGPTEGTVYGLPVTDRAVETASDAGKAIEPLRSMPQIPTARALELMTSASPPAGLVIGRDAEQVPVVAPFFRPEETRINLIGGVYLARLLVFRALALGTRVAVCTTRPQEWNGLGESATNRNDRLAVLHGDQPVTVEASQHSPALYVYDVGERGSQTKPVLGPWRTQLTVLPRLTNFADDLTSEAHMTVLQRLTAEEAQIARSSIRVNQEVLQWLQMLHDDMIAMLRKGQKEKYLWCAPTSIEAQMFGAPMRTY